VGVPVRDVIAAATGAGGSDVAAGGAFAVAAGPTERTRRDGLAADQAATAASADWRSAGRWNWRGDDRRDQAARTDDRPDTPRPADRPTEPPSPSRPRSRPPPSGPPPASGPTPPPARHTAAPPTHRDDRAGHHRTAHDEAADHRAPPDRATDHVRTARR
jgi:hypothetical protein